MRILISNDDGYFSPGIEKLAEVASAFGEVTQLAERLRRCLSVRVAHNGFLYVNGTPTDCVHIAVTGLLEHKPDIVLS